MEKIYLSPGDREFIKELSARGLRIRNLPQWQVARLALARSLQIPEPPEETLDDVTGEGKGSELHLSQVTGLTKPEGEDLTDYFKLLLSEYHDEDLLSDEDAFLKYLRRHIRRGLKEFRASWKAGNDFHDYLYQEMFRQNIQSSTQNADVLSEGLNSALAELGIRATEKEITRGPRIDRHIYRLEDASDFERMRRGLDQLEFLTGIRPLSLIEEMGERQVGLDVPISEDQWYFPSIEEITTEVLDQGYLPVTPGVDVVGQPVVFDLADTPHLFVAGTTGSGKSICLHSIIYSILLQTADVELVLADPKKVEFAPYEALRCLWNKRIIYEANEIAETLEALVEEMERRQTLLLDVGANNIAQAQERGLKIPRIVVLIEELADLFLQNEQSVTACIRLAQKARATGIHLVLATQRPDAETFPGLLRSNIPSRIALSVRTSRESRIILEETGAERLLGKGDMIIRLLQGRSIRAHGFLVENEDIARIVAFANQRAAEHIIPGEAK